MICPHDNCPCLIYEYSIREVVETEIYEKYIEFKKDSFLLDRTRSGSLRKCPSETCNYMFEFDPMPVFLNPAPREESGELKFGDPMGGWYHRTTYL